MARKQKKRQKRLAAREHPPDQPLEPSSTGESPHRELLQPALLAGNRVELLEIVLKKLSIERDDDVGTEPLITATSQTAGKFGIDPEQDKLYFQPTLTLLGYEESDGTKKHKRVLQIEATFTLIYSCANVALIPNEHLSEFATRDGLIHTWPFWRELVMTASSRMRVAPIVVSLLRITREKPETHKD
jgi:hypothetical protein